MSSKFIILWLPVYCIFLHVAAAIECLSIDEDNYKCHLGSTTPYRFIANPDDSPLNYSECNEVKIWMLIRHGTRFPGKKMIRRMVKVLPELPHRIIERYKNNGSMVLSDLIEELIEWKPHSMITGNEKKLTEEGERELVDLAEIFQSRFPALLPEIYSNETYKFKYTNTQRAEVSAKHFVLGLFGQRASQKVWFYPPENKDNVLRSYKNCDRWQAEVKHNSDVNEQINLFKRSKIVNNTLDEISNRLGFRIDYDTASTLYSACAYETAWTENASSPWCKILSLYDFKVLEYAEDLELYWIDGYGIPLTYEQVCPTLRDMFQFFESDSDVKATIYFSHSGMTMKLLSLLGLAKDEIPLTHDSFELHRDNRAWKASRIDAFATNLAFILYECDKCGRGILTMHQERVVNIPGCPENLPCPISVFQQLFSRSIDNCRFEEMCKL